MNRKFNQKTILSAAAAFILPVFLICVIYCFNGIYPFGDKTLFTNDMSYEYVGIFSYLGHLLRGDADVLYTFSKAIGGDMAGLFGYYLLSPLNLISVFFQPDEMPVFILVLTLLKIGFCGLTMHLYLQNLGHSPFVCLFSTAYALMSYNIAYQQNIMWLDGVILLPLIVWGIDDISRNGKVLLYTLSLAAGLAANFYIGYMLCVFSVLYFLVHFLLKLTVRPGKDNGKIIVRYISSSLLAGGLAAAALIPTAISLQDGKDEMHLGKLLKFEMIHKPLDVLRNLLPNQFDINGGTFGSPNIYCGLFVVIFVLLYLGNRRLEWQKRLGNLILILFLFTSLLFKNFERAWHGLVLPTGYPHRYSFLLSFLLVIMAYAGWMAVMDSNAKDPVRLNGRRVLCAAVCLVGIFELTFNGIMILKRFEYHKAEAYRQSVQEDLEYTAKIREQDKSFYRMEDIHGGFGMDNPMLLNYRGLASSYSGEKAATKKAAGNLGMNEKSTWIAYHDQMSVGMESLLSMKYLITGENTQKKYYILLRKEKNLLVYENPYVLPMGVLTDASILQADIENRDMFAIQNEIWNSILRTDEMLYHPIEAEELYREDDGITYEFTVDGDEVIYTNFFDEGMVDSCKVFVNNREQLTFKPEKMPYRLGDFREGDVIRVEIRSEEKNINWYDLYFYYERISVLENQIQRIHSEAYRIEQFNEHSFKGKISNYDGGERFALFTIPYDEGWIVKIDGKRIEPERALDALMCIPIPEGEHELTLTFFPRGLAAGGFISMFSLAAVIYIYKKTKGKIY